MPCSSLEGRSIREVKKQTKKTPWWPKGVYEIFLSKFVKALGGTSGLLVTIFKKEEAVLKS